MVREWPVPTTQTKVHSFLGTASYYRRFVQNFGMIARPLHRLTEKNRPYLCQIAFETLRKKLVESPILAYPSSEAAFILDTNFSAIAIGAVLSQVQDGVERPIAYASLGAEQVGAKLQCYQERAVGSSILLQIFSALPDIKEVQATHGSCRPEVIADLQGRHWNVGQVAKHPGGVKQGDRAQGWQESWQRRWFEQTTKRAARRREMLRQRRPRD